jgi:PAS domain S-box-containing protein
MADPDRYTVLIVDDEPLILNALQRLLRRKFEVRQALSGKEALAVLRAEPVDVIVADQHMPGLSGSELLSQAKVDAPDAARLLLTGSADVADLAAAVNLGEVHAYLTKPWESDSLVATVENAAERVRQKRANRQLAEALAAANAELTERAAQLQAAVRSLESEAAARRQAEEALRASVAQYRIVADNTHDWEFWLEPGGTFVYTSPACERITGYAPHEFMENPDLLEHIVHPADRTRWVAHRREHASGHMLGELEFRITTRQGAERWLGHVCQPVYDPAGKWLGVRGSHRDITARKQTEHELAEYRQHLEALVVRRTGDLKEANEQLRGEVVERRQIEEALRLSEARYRMYIDHSPESMFVADTAGRYRDANQAACRQVGYTREALLALSIGDLVPPEDLETAMAQFGKVVTTGAFSGELRLRRKDGTLVPVILSAVALPDGQILAFSIDITERKRAEEALRASERKFRSFIEQSSDSLTLTDEAGRLIEWNPASERITGVTRKEALGQFIWDVNLRLAEPAARTAGQLDRIKTMLLAALESGQSPLFNQPLETVYQHSDGTLHNLQQVVFPIRTERGFRLGSIGYDITERKRAELALRESEDSFRGIFETLAVGIFEATPTGQLVRVNQTYARMFGYASPEAALTDLVDPAGQLYVRPERRADLIARAMAASTATAENEYRRRDGSLFTGWLTLQAFRGQTGEVVRLLGYVQDITELKRAESEIQLLNAELESRIRERTAQLETEIAEHHQAEVKQAQLLDQLEQQARSRERELAALYQVTAASMVGGSREAQLQRLLETVRQLGDSPAGVIHLLTHEPGSGGAAPEWRLAAAQGLAPTDAAWLETSLADGPWSLVARRQGITLIPSLLDEFPATPRELSLVGGAYLGLPIHVKDHWLGVLSLFRPAGRRFTALETSLSAALIDQLGLAVESILLRQRSEEAAVVEERQRLARDLHDSVTQLVYSLVLFAGAGREAAKAGDVPKLTHQLNRMDATAQQALKEMRLLLYELRPSALQSAGLVKALQQRLDMVERRANVTAELTCTGAAEIPAALQPNLYQIAQEALNNALKHARAGRVTIQIEAAEAVTLAVTDNGLGFDLAEVADGGGLGLGIMRERADALGGSLQITSAPAQGTRVTVVVPRIS